MGLYVHRVLWGDHDVCPDYGHDMALTYINAMSRSVKTMCTNRPTRAKSSSFYCWFYDFDKDDDDVDAVM
jgi:hypothetical protein